MFEIIDDKNKRIIISLHLEQIYIEMKSKENIREESILFRKDKLSKSCVDYLVSLQFDDQRYKEYECIVDFEYVKYMVQNTKEKFEKWLGNLPQVKIIHCKNFELYEELKKKGIHEEITLGYRTSFKEYAKKYIIDKCLDPSGYTTQIGIQLGVYIDLKRIINDSIEMLRWCYIIAYDLYKYLLEVDEKLETMPSFFCHTMNGAYIAGILSQFLGNDLVYVDHLGPYNKLNKVDFYKERTGTREYIIVADMMCQGNEFLRAKNIVEYLGGTVRGGAGILKMDISDLLSNNQISCFAINYTPDEAREELHYTIQTRLCTENYSSRLCDRKEN